MVNFAAKASLLAGAFLVLGSCNTAENIAASFVPSQPQHYDASHLKSGTYRLDPEHGSLHFSFVHMGFSKVVARFNRFDATLEFDKENPESARLEVTLDPASVDTNNAKFDEILRGEDYFDVARFPEARFVSDRVVFTGDNTADLAGTLTLHGVSRPVTLRVTFNGGGENWLSGKYTLGFAAHANVKRSDFGLTNLLALTSDQVEIEIHAEFQLEEKG